MREITYQTLSWLSYAERAMSIAEIQCALALTQFGAPLDDGNFHVESAILTACTPAQILITRSNSTGNIGFIRTFMTRFIIAA
jgi:hypothetical protein